MNFDRDEGQELAIESIRRFLGAVDITARHALRNEAGGYSRARWVQLADLGLLALAAPQSMGGLGGSMVDLALVAEALGNGLAIDPWVENGLLPIRLAAAVGNDALVSDLISGNCFTAAAIFEPDQRFETTPKTTRCDQGKVNGTKRPVFGASLADVILATAGNSGALHLGTVTAGAPGLGAQSYRVIDGSFAQTLEFRNVDADLRPLSPDAFARVIGDVRLCAAAEMLGLAQKMFDDTLDYTRERRQFGVAIGSFQALQHRLVECYAALEQARSMVLRTAMQEPVTADVEWGRLAAGAKAYVGEAARRIGLEAVQMHGGMGQTDELAIGHALKRVMLLDTLFGDQAQSLRVYAKAA